MTVRETQDRWNDAADERRDHDGDSGLGALLLRIVRGGTSVEREAAAKRNRASIDSGRPFPPPASELRATLGLLSPQEFARFVERERSLADRGSRVFSLMVLRRREGTLESWAKLARELRARLRSTDLVGALGPGELGVLLSDTNPPGARVVSGWVSRTATNLGVRLAPVIYVYPTVEEALEGEADSGTTSARLPRHEEDEGSDDDDPPRGGLRLVDEAVTVKREVSTPPVAMPAVASIALGAESGARDANELELGNGRWPMEDLWGRLGAPLPKWKRCMDVMIVALFAPLLAPLLLAIVLAIKLDSKGPVIFRQKRAGRGGRPFTLYKFRSMHVDAEKRRAELAAQNEKDGPIFKIKNDPRVTRVGKLLRRWSLDELPQLWNIVVGDLSLVGPRSPTFDEVVQYERWQRRRLDITGGITCIWQVSGRSHVSFRDWMRMDMQYVRRRGLALDVELLARTLPAVLSGRGAY